MAFTAADTAHIRRLTNLTDLVTSLNSIEPGALKHIGVMTSLRYLGLVGVELLDSGLAYLAGLTGLQTLLIYHTGITNAGLGQLRGMGHMRRLDIGGNQITGGGLMQLTHLIELEQLSLAGLTALEDSDLAFLAAFPNLQEVDLTHTAITDGAVEYLSVLPRLRSLETWGSSMSREGIDSLQRALPACKIYSGFRAAI